MTGIGYTMNLGNNLSKACWQARQTIASLLIAKKSLPEMEDTLQRDILEREIRSLITCIRISEHLIRTTAQLHPETTETFSPKEL